MFFKPAFGMTGLIGYPYMFFGELIEPVVEILGLIFVSVGIYLGFLSWQIFLYYLFVSIGVSLFLSLMSIILEIVSFRIYHSPFQMVRLILYAIIENLGIRQVS